MQEAFDIMSSKSKHYYSNGGIYMKMMRVVLIALIPVHWPLCGSLGYRLCSY